MQIGLNIKKIREQKGLLQKEIALAADGGAGVSNLLELLDKEMRVAMTLTGAKTIADINSDCLAKLDI